MTKEDIKDALQACSAIISPCVNCPYKDVENCYDTLNNDARELIIEQEKEIERLKEENKKDFDNFVKVNDELLKANMKLSVDKKQAQINVLNKLKDKMFEREYMGVKYKERIFYESEIDDMIAEVQNGEDKG